MTDFSWSSVKTICKDKWEKVNYSNKTNQTLPLQICDTLSVLNLTPVLF